MKKIIVLIISLFLVVGCNMDNSPSKQVESFLNKYQTMNEEVINQLHEVVDSAGTMSEKQKETYSGLMKKQYQNMSYKIKDESIDGDISTVQVEVNVYDYAKAISKAESYLLSNKDEFLNDEKQVDEEKFMKYKLEKMEEVKDKVTYTINFTLSKKDGKWVMDNITDIDRQKLHGLYS